MKAKKAAEEKPKRASEKKAGTAKAAKGSQVISHSYLIRSDLNIAGSGASLAKINSSGPKISRTTIFALVEI